VQELLELVRQGKINCIVVKDLSRFGRNMIETGYYIERVFPLYRVRFISLSDDFDSAEHEGDTGGLDIAFKFLIHEQYSRDLSRKIKSAKHAKALRGEFVTKNCAFGHKKVGNRLEIDLPAAETVRLIFALAAQGQSLSKIAARLYEEKRPTPTEHKRLSRNVLAKDFAGIWGNPQILEILCDEQYIGTYVAGKTKRLEVGSRKSVKVPPSEWIRIPNHHPAIIGKEVFEAAREQIGRKGEPLRNREIGTSQRYKDSASPLKSMVFCGCCGHTMRLSSTKNAAFHCAFTHAAPDVECHRLKILGSELEAAVMKSIREQARAVLKSMSDSPPTTAQESQVTQIEDVKRSLYERFILGEINVDEYKTAKAGLDAAFDRAKSTQKIARESASKTVDDDLRKIAEDAVKAKNLTRPVVEGLVERVKVFPGGRVEVAWKEAVSLLLGRVG